MWQAGCVFVSFSLTLETELFWDMESYQDTQSLDIIQNLTGLYCRVFLFLSSNGSLQPFVGGTN